LQLWWIFASKSSEKYYKVTIVLENLPYYSLTTTRSLIQQ